MANGKLIINLDVMFMNDLVMSLVLLWATAKFARLRIKIWPLMLSAVIGSLYTLILVLPVFRQLPNPMAIFLHLGLNLLTAVLMIRTAFGQMKVQKFLKTLGYFYLITFLAGGSALSIYFTLGFSPTQWIFGWMQLKNVYSWLYFAGVIITLIFGRYCWSLFRERLAKEKLHLKFSIWIGDREVQLTGFLDTGNQLRDPLTRLPVIVVERDAVLGLFPTEIVEILEADLDLVDRAEKLLASSWYQRFQIIPFSSIGNHSDLLIGCKPDRIEFVGDAFCQIGQVILALYQGELDLEGDYQALLHPELLAAI